MTLEKWFKVRTAQGTTIARMCAKREAETHEEWNSRTWLFTGGWTHPDHRGSGHFRTLWDERMAWTLEQKPRFIEGWCCEANEKFFVEAGFVHVRSIDGEKLMRLAVDEREPLTRAGTSRRMRIPSK